METRRDQRIKLKFQFYLSKHTVQMWTKCVQRTEWYKTIKVFNVDFLTRTNAEVWSASVTELKKTKHLPEEELQGQKSNRANIQGRGSTREQEWNRTDWPTFKTPMSSFRTQFGFSLIDIPPNLELFKNTGLTEIWKEQTFLHLRH